MATTTPVEEVRLDITDGVAVITLDAPQRRNALTPGVSGKRWIWSASSC
jgi:enoyl-CoA hydratase/carnithine racemase